MGRLQCWLLRGIELVTIQRVYECLPCLHFRNPGFGVIVLFVFCFLTHDIHIWSILSNFERCFDRQFFGICVRNARFSFNRVYFFCHGLGSDGILHICSTVSLSSMLCTIGRYLGHNTHTLSLARVDNDNILGSVSTLCLSSNKFMNFVC